MPDGIAAKEAAMEPAKRLRNNRQVRTYVEGMIRGVRIDPRKMPMEKTV